MHFPLEPTQWLDTDRDGWGDNQTFGAARIDDFPENPTQWRDTDDDGWGDNQTYGASQVDDFPLVPSQYRTLMAMGMVIIKQDLRVMYVFIQPPRKWNLDGFLDLID